MYGMGLHFGKIISINELADKLIDNSRLSTYSTFLFELS